MDQLVESLLPRLPAWLIPPGTVVLLLLLIWPVLREIWTEVIPSYRKYAREKRRLELLKLYYEVEAITKDHELSKSLPILSDALSALVRADVPEAVTFQHGKESAVSISRRQAFWMGSLGGLVVFTISAILSIDNYIRLWKGELIVTSIKFVVIFTIIKVMIMALIGGVSAWLSNSKRPLEAFVSGTIVPLLLALLLSASAHWPGSGPR